MKIDLKSYLMAKKRKYANPMAADFASDARRDSQFPTGYRDESVFKDYLWRCGACLEAHEGLDLVLAYAKRSSFCR